MVVRSLVGAAVLIVGLAGPASARPCTEEVVAAASDAPTAQPFEGTSHNLEAMTDYREGITRTILACV